MRKWQRKIYKGLKRFQRSNSSSAAVFAEKECFYMALASFVADADRSFIIITQDFLISDQLADDLRSFLSLINIYRDIYVLPEIESVNDQPMSEKLSGRHKIYDTTTSKGNIYFASITAALIPVPDPRRFRDGKLLLTAGETRWPPEKLAEFLVNADYDNEIQVNQPGEFSWRGGILDVYSPVDSYPIRIDYWGNSVESIRYFDPETQRSISEIGECTIVPCHKPSHSKDSVSNYHFLDFFDIETSTIVLCDIASIECQRNRFGNDRYTASWQQILASCHKKIFLEHLENLATSTVDRKGTPSFFSLGHMATHVLPDLEESTSLLHQQYVQQHLLQWSEEGYDFVLCAARTDVETRYPDFLAEEHSRLNHSSLVIKENRLSTGGIFPEEKIIVLSEADLFGKPVSKRRTSKTSHYHIERSLHTGLELTEGDFAVHAVHGICRYTGLKREQFSDRTQEVLVLEFADDVNLLVPLEQAYLVSRYVGANKKLPKLSRVGAAVWRKAKHAAMEAVNDLASELIRIQAVRNSTQGFSFVEYDEHDMMNFTESFPYLETHDQQLAIEHILGDMERRQPMDRLICGDVGYGKTEVAMRAACRAVLCNKQVAVLVPTTVLAQQHYLTFTERFSELPVIIESLSRFRNPAEQKSILKGLTTGQIDIVIGTHRLLQSDIQFKDLGLIIIDEEQRFGVRHKETLKKLRMNLDVLTLSATPIPRTLHMSMSGVKDMSTILTAPLDRLPIKTIVLEYDEQVIKKAVYNEIRRGGQVYYLHNRVKSIYEVQEKLVSLLPEISIDVAHGQMHEVDLESAMIRFIEGKTHVLLCTTIIESGMDIPNANTIIIDRADQFGLAELYQLRGRVGRYDRQAYAYLLLPKRLTILNNAKKRLAAIRAYTQLGAGFKLALRDLEIRGAGNIIGAEQSGHISAIGFELYCQLMKEAVARLKQQPSPIRQDVKLNLDFLAFGRSNASTISAEIPVDFIADDDQRVHCYKRLSRFMKTKEVDEFSLELRDRFGALPSAVVNLLKVTRLRILAAERQVHEISVKGQRIIVETQNGLFQTPNKRLPKLQSQNPEEFLDELLNVISNLGGSSRINRKRPSSSGNTTVETRLSNQLTPVSMLS